MLLLPFLAWASPAFVILAPAFVIASARVADLRQEGGLNSPLASEDAAGHTRSPTAAALLLGPTPRAEATRCPTCRNFFAGMMLFGGLLGDCAGGWRHDAFERRAVGTQLARLRRPPPHAGHAQAAGDADQEGRDGVRGAPLADPHRPWHRPGALRPHNHRPATNAGSPGRPAPPTRPSLQTSNRAMSPHRLPDRLEATWRHLNLANHGMRSRRPRPTRRCVGPAPARRPGTPDRTWSTSTRSYRSLSTSLSVRL